MTTAIHAPIDSKGQEKKTKSWGGSANSNGCCRELLKTKELNLYNQ